MLAKLLRKLKGLLGSSTPPPKQLTPRGPKLGDVVGGVAINSYSQLTKHTEFFPGESYRLGEAIVTVHANKESMLAAIEAVDARRALKDEARRERGIQIMLMSPEELKQFKLGEWLQERNKKHSVIRGILGRWWDRDRNDYFKQLEAKYMPPPPSGEAKPIEAEETVKNVVKVP